MAERENLTLQKQLQQTVRLKIRETMLDMMGKVLANRPLDPVAFVAKILESKQDGTLLVQNAFSLISETHHSQPIFFTNVKLAYDILSQNKVKKGVFGVNGLVYTELLRMMCKDLPYLVTNKLFKKLECYDFEVLPFDVFHSGVFTCCVLQDYIRLSDSLFSTIDKPSNDMADGMICEVLLSQLSLAVGKSPTKSFSRLESSHQLGPDSLTVAIEQAQKYSRAHVPKVTKRSEFIGDACDLFLTKIKKLI